MYLYTYKYVHHSEKIQNIVVAFCIIFNTRVERLKNEFTVNGNDHVTTIHIFVMSTKLSAVYSHQRNVSEVSDGYDKNQCERIEGDDRDMP